MTDNNTVNFETFKKTRSVEEAERYQRILNWKADTLVEAIESGKPSDGLSHMVAVLTQVNKAELNDAKKEILDILDNLERRGYKKETEQYRWALQEYYK